MSALEYLRKSGLQVRLSGPSHLAVRGTRSTEQDDFIRRNKAELLQLLHAENAAAMSYALPVASKQTTAISLSFRLLNTGAGGNQGGNVIFQHAELIAVVSNLFERYGCRLDITHLERSLQRMHSLQIIDDEMLRRLHDRLNY